MQSFYLVPRFLHMGTELYPRFSQASKRERERERDRERQRERERQRQRETERERQREGGREGARERETERERESLLFMDFLEFPKKYSPNTA